MHVEFTPELPAFKRNVFKSMQMGNLIKFIVTYKVVFFISVYNQSTVMSRLYQPKRVLREMADIP